MSAILCLPNHCFDIELLHSSRMFALSLHLIKDLLIYHLLLQKQSPLLCLTTRTSIKKLAKMRPKNDKQKNGARPHFHIFSCKQEMGFGPFSPPNNKTAPVCAPAEVQASPSILLGYTYKYFTFIFHLSFMEDILKSDNSEIYPTL
jgi:hypothetical protein